MIPEWSHELSINRPGFIVRNVIVAVAFTALLKITPFEPCRPLGKSKDNILFDLEHWRKFMTVK